MTALLNAPETDSSARHNAVTCGLHDCRFCAIEHGGTDLCIDLYGEAPAVEIPGVPDSFHVLHCAFPLGYRGCHLLLTPKSHYRSLASCHDQSEVRRAVDATLHTLREMYPDHWFFIFEHGPGEIDQRAVKCGGCHVDHAHGHILAFSRDVEFEDILDMTESALEDLGWDLESQRAVTAEPFVNIGEFTGEKPYLHVGRITDDGAEAYTYQQVSAAAAIPSQLLRKLAAAADGHPEPTYWNWKIALQQKLADRIEWFGDAVRTFKQDLRAHLAM